MYVYLLNHTEAFDRIRHQGMLEMLKRLNIDGKDIQPIWNLYWEQTAAIGINNEVGQFKKITWGVHWGCVFSPDLSSLYVENILVELDGNAG